MLNYSALQLIPAEHVNVRVLFIIILSGSMSYICIYFSQPNYSDLQKTAKEHCEIDARYAEVYRKKERLPTYLKYILLWTPKTYGPFYDFGEGQENFIRYNCPVIDCYVTANRHFFGKNFMKFDAVAFNGRNLNPWDVPQNRHAHQKFIYVNAESAQNYVVCDKVFDNFFNLTFTYRLDSDLVYRYFQIKNLKNDIVGPSQNIDWTTNDTINNDLDDETKLKWKSKKTAAAWMVSNCHTLNKREKLASEISRSLKLVNLSLDIFGWCGTKTCKEDICWNNMEKEYYFYFAFENSNSEDYVTEKLLNPLQHFMIPIVFGGAQYSRFLPPGSYLDASKLSSTELVAKMSEIISSKDLYKQFFKWRSYYKYVAGNRQNVCLICSAVHNESIIKPTNTWKDFRKWWFPEYKKRCRSFFRSIMEFLSMQSREYN